MAYASKDDVKPILRILLSDTTEDTAITACIASADGYIDNILKFHGFSVPLSSVPQTIKDASAHYAASFFRERIAGQPEEAQRLQSLGDKFLTAYIEAEKEPVVKMA